MRVRIGPVVHSFLTINGSGWSVGDEAVNLFLACDYTYLGESGLIVSDDTTCMACLVSISRRGI